MKRLIILILFVILIVCAAIPLRAVDAETTSRQGDVVSVKTSNAEKGSMSLAECPVWAQVVVFGVVGLFGWLAVAALWMKGNEPELG